MYKRQGDTVIIFDEIQEFPDIATALKSFRIDGRFDVICSGSLLGIHYRKIHSNSVGYKTDYEMFSMDFEEFLWAKGYSEKHIEDILKHMKTGTPFSETELSVYKKLDVYKRQQITRQNHGYTHSLSPALVI